jgi:hypothetical protein
MAMEAARGTLIMFLEEDYVVEPGFIEWHRQVHRRLSPFISCADNPYPKGTSNNPAEVILTRSKFSSHAGAITRYNLDTLLASTWTRYFEEEAHNHIIRHRLLTVMPGMPRAYDTGVAGMNQPGKDLIVELKNPPTPEHFEEIDWQWKWHKDYAAQRKWGWR